MIAVIGDVHGCFYTLEALYNKIQDKYPDIPIYCVGDLVDRGMNSFEVIRFFIRNNIRFTPGNHDYMFYAFVRDPDSQFARSWIFNGNESTLKSYLEHFDCISMHVDFIRNAPLYYNTQDCFISHAGISAKYEKFLNPSVDLEDTELVGMIRSESESESGVLWTRDRLLNIGKMQVVGHTSQREVNYDSKSNVVYVDTGAFLGRKLSAVIVHQGEILEVLAESTHRNDLK
ncbi:MAG: metallophosphoesterase [Bacteroidota bacterium]